jgi:hypothetical protein
VSAQPLPERPNLDQLKRQAKELLEEWRRAPSSDAQDLRLRDAQLALAQKYGFDSWDALRVRVEDLSGHSGAREPRRGIVYDDPILDVIPLKGPFTKDDARRLAEQGVGGVKVEASVPPHALVHLADVPTLRRIDLSNRNDLVDDDVAFLEAMPWLTAVSLANCGKIGDKAVAYLRRHQELEQINLQWTAAGDQSVAALAGKRRLSRVVLGNALTDAGVARLRDFPALAIASGADSFLAVSMARTLTDQALIDIGALKGVAALDLHMSAFGSPHYTARGVAHLGAMTSLEALNFHGQLATDPVLREIAGIPKLRWLHCQDIVSGDDGFIALGACTTLEKLAARFCAHVTDRGFAAIARLPRLASLNLGGPKLTDAAMAHLADAPRLKELGPILFGDDAFAHIARIPRLEKLTNMYNRSTTDAATRHLRNHSRLVYYSAFGTQITDESLRILAGLPRLETLEFENCAGISDDGVRELTRLPRLRRLTVWSCVNVEGKWIDSVPPGVAAKSDLGPPGQAEGYRAETLMDYPDLPVGEARGPRGDAPSSGLLSRLVDFGVRSRYVEDGVQISVEPGMDTRWIGLITRDGFAAPVRIELVVRPLTELRLRFGRHNQYFSFDERGNFKDAAPWFMRTDAQKGRAHHSEEATPIPQDAWTRVTLEVDERERRLLVNGQLRHSWQGDFGGTRSRVGIGLLQSSLTVRDLNVTSLRES